MYLSVLVAIITFIILFIKNRITKTHTKTQQQIPGPVPSNSKDGNIPDIIQAGSLHHFLLEVHKKYGAVVQFRLGEKMCVSTSSPTAYRDQMKIFNKPDDSMEFMSPVFGRRCIQFVNGEEAKDRRQKYDEYLGQHYIRTYIPTLKQIISDHLIKIDPSEPFSVYKKMFHLSCKAVGCTMFGDHFNNDDNVENFRCLYEEFWPLLEKNFTQGLPKEGSEERIHFDDNVRKVMNLINKLKKDRQSAHDRKFIDVVMETGNDVESINGDILSYLVGGFHSTSVSLTWCLYFAGKHPHLQDKIHQELVDVLGDNEEINEECFSRFRYLKQFINETLRLRFVAPVTNRAAEAGTNICGYDIPTGTTLIHALSVTLTDEKLWKNPHTFDPERFNLDNSKGRSPLVFCPFGFAGKRMCPGQRFFYAESLLYLASLFRKFKFELISDKDIPITYGLLTRPAEEIFMSLTTR